MIHRLHVEETRYDTRMYCGLVYTHAATGSAAAIPLHLHLIVPRGAPDQRFPLLIYLGGGGWRVSSPERHLPELAWFAAQGCVVASVEYRTTANSRFPAQIEDVKTAIRFLRKNSAAFGIDPRFVHLMGGSAGAYLAAMAALTGGTDRFRGTDWPDQSDAVTSAVCLYGLFDFLAYREPLLARADSALPLQLFLPDTGEETLRSASPLSYVREDTVPFLLLHGTRDRMVPWTQSSAFHDKLRQAGRDVELYLLEDADHADRAFSQAPVQDIVFNFLSKSWR